MSGSKLNPARIPGRIILALGLLMLLAVSCGIDTGEERLELEQSARRVESVLATVSRVLPAIPVDIGQDGRVERIANFPAATVNDFFEDLTGTPLVGRIVFIDEDGLRWLDRSNIQHVTVLPRPQGLFLLANGKPLPHIAWNEATLDNLVDLIGRFQDDGREAFSLMSPETFEALEVLMPIASRIDLRFDFRFPDIAGVGPSDRQPIPLPSRRTVNTLRDASRLETPPLQSVDFQLSFKPFEVDGEQGWVPAFFGFSTLDLQRLIDGLELDADGEVEVPRMVLREDLRARIEAENIRHVALEMRHDGLFARVDGALLPHLAWSEESLTNLSALLQQIYPGRDEELPADAAWVPLVRNTAPMYNDYELALQLSFPAR